MVSIANRVLHYLEKSFGISLQQVVMVNLLGQPYRLIKGTLRPKPDYDDAWLLALACDAQIVFDIGSNIGQSALLLLHPGRVQEIVLVDANPLALSQAAQNLILNGWSERARFVCAFVSDQMDQTVDFFTVGTGAAGSFYASHAKTASTLKSKQTVPTTTVDHLVTVLNSLPDLVKIDVEGAERLVLKGATTLASRKHTMFFVEMHSSYELPMEENARHVLNWCQQVGYQAWYMKDKTKLTTPEPIQRRGRCHLLLLPCEAGFPESLNELEQSAPVEKVRIIRNFNSLVAAHAGRS
ncbi:MAG TPA: FkbM family methyltransferase [Anaerolineales bacterium]|nr:FkbM family methyltransferase [Anaerolineales bacterium]